MQVTIVGYICGQQKIQNNFDYFMAFFDKMMRGQKWTAYFS